MRHAEHAAVQYVETKQSAMTQLLEDLVNIDSNSRDKDDVINVFERLESFFQEHGLEVSWHEHDGIKNAISVRVPGRNEELDPILLMGHCDTVFPRGEAKRRPFSISDGLAYGPGVADMKAGVAMNAFIVAAAHRAGGMEHPLIALFTNDEEIGSPTSRFIIEHFAKLAKTVFNAEPGRPGGKVVTQRKGGVFFDLRIQGKAAHSGANFTDGVSAVSELANKILMLDALTDISEGITINVGLISGGQSVNTVAPDARCSIDLRIHSLEDRDRLVAKIQEIIQKPSIEGTRSELKIVGEFRPFVSSPESAELFELYKQSAEEIGLQVSAEHSGGCADSGITSSLGCATLCATGPVGGKPHTQEEYVELDTLIPRAQAVIRTILKLDARAADSMTNAVKQERA